MTLSDLIAELRTPSGQTGPLDAAYLRGATAAWHMVLGAALAWPVSGVGWTAGLTIAALYWGLKEAGDIRRGGRFWDGLEDAACVWIGTFAGPAWWGVAALAASGYVFVMGALRR